MMPRQSNLGVIAILVLLGFVVLLLNAPNLFAYLLIAGAVVAGLVVLLVIGYAIFCLAWNCLSATRRMRARVLRRRMKQWDVSSVGDSGLARLGMMGRDKEAAWKAYSRKMARGKVAEITFAAGTNYFVTYLVDGKELEFAVPEEYYVKSTEGTPGLLVYRGEQFECFIPNVCN